TQLRLLLETGLLPECRSLRVVLSFGEVFPPLLEEKIRTSTSAHLILFYGATEAPSLAYRYSRKEHLPAGCNIGRPGAGKIIRVLNAEGQILPVGTPGELHVGGAGLSQGYFKNEALTRERFIPDPLAQNPDSRLFKTGDRGRILPDGSIEFLGREDDLVKIRGFRVEVNLVEQALNALPGISHAAAFAWDDGQGNKLLTGYLVPSTGTSPNLPEWRRALAETLPSYAIPGALVVLDRLPTSASGKVVKTALPPPHSREAWIDDLWEAPTDPLETQIAGIWSQVLAIDRIGRQDTFFELGGTSLRALSLLNKISTILKVDLPPIALLENPTLAVLSERVCTCLAGNKHRAPQSEFLFILRKEGSGPPIFILPGGWGGENELLVFAALLRKLKTDRPVFGIPSRAMDPAWDLPSRLETQAEAVFNAVRGVQPAGPYVFIGECLAGVMAAALAARAEALGHPSGLVILLDARVGTASTTGDQANQGNNSSLPERIQHYYRLLKQHQPSAIDHRVELILSSEINPPETFADGWRAIARSGMAVHRVSGTHDSYIREDAEETARLLENLIHKG
ncbi:MAG: AMP-binding protein, partial [Verrucomicrobium sp.]